MFNHYYDKVGQTYWQYMEPQKEFVVKAQKAISQGDPVSLSIQHRSVRIMVPSLTIASSSTMGS